MKTFFAWLVCAVALLCVSGTGYCGMDDRPPVAAAAEISRVTNDIAALEVEREEVLRDVAERYKSAALADRSALEAEGANLWADYEARYLSLLVEYYSLSGDGQQAALAQQSLEGLLNPSATGTPQSLPRDLILDLSEVSKSDEQGVTNVR